MAKRPKTRLTTSVTYAGSLGAALDEIGFKPLGRRIKVKTSVGLQMRTRKPEIARGRQQD